MVMTAAEPSVSDEKPDGQAYQQKNENEPYEKWEEEKKGADYNTRNYCPDWKTHNKRFNSE